jgi:Holliday junction resolvasome RuvABC endonuclease subunit
MRIIGLDLSMSATGVCMPDGSTVVIKPKGKGDARLLPVHERLSAALRVARPDLAVVEDIRAGLKGDAARIIPMVHAAALLALMQAGVPYVYVNAMTLKVYATGRGGADKAAMMRAARERAGRVFRDDNECDAWWLHAAGRAAYGSLVVSVPDKQAQALQGVAWPVVNGAHPMVVSIPAPSSGRGASRRRAAA